MKIKRINCLKIVELTNKLKNKIFNIETQYKLLLINKQCKQEEEIYNEQLSLIIEKHAEREAKGSYIYNDQGAIKIKTEYKNDCLNLTSQLEMVEVTMPDIYFTIDELESLELSLLELEILEPFIKI